jgi:hypothetical protein
MYSLNGELIISKTNNHISPHLFSHSVQALQLSTGIAPFAMSLQMSQDMVDLLTSCSQEVTLSLKYCEGSEHILYINGEQHMLRYQTLDPKVGDVLIRDSDDTFTSLGSLHGNSRLLASAEDQRKRLMEFKKKTEESKQKPMSSAFSGTKYHSSVSTTKNPSYSIPLKQLVMHVLVSKGDGWTLKELAATCRDKLILGGNKENDIDVTHLEERVRDVCKLGK